MTRVVPARTPDAILVAGDAVRAGRLVAVPTETVYGVACALDSAALERLLDAKRRPAAKGITLLLDDLDQAAPLVPLHEAARRLAARFWPGPLTLVLPLLAGVELPESLTGGRPSVGIRIPDNPVTRSLARALGPLPTSSANISGEADATTAAAVVAAFGDAIAVVLDDGPSPGGVPSTVVAIDETGDWQVLRPGALTEAEIREAVAAP